jgi:hypothetical protein
MGVRQPTPVLVAIGFVLVAAGLLGYAVTFFGLPIINAVLCFSSCRAGPGPTFWDLDVSSWTTLSGQSAASPTMFGLLFFALENLPLLAALVMASAGVGFVMAQQPILITRLSRSWVVGAVPLVLAAPFLFIYTEVGIGYWSSLASYACTGIGILLVRTTYPESQRVR